MIVEFKSRIDYNTEIRMGVSNTDGRSSDVILRRGWDFLWKRMATHFSWFSRRSQEVEMLWRVVISF